MNAASVDILVLKEVVDSLGRVFCTRDVSEHPRMIEVHKGLTSDSNYHGSVGKRLSQERHTLGIDELRKATSRGSRWEKRGLITRAPGSEFGRKTVQPGAQAQPQEIGPQCAEDPPFKARMRLHQSWYRANVLGVPCGTGPKPGSTGKFGNMLTRSDGAAGLNFLTPAIVQCARERVAQRSGTVEPFRLFHNMLSSQPMCFNLFGPLVVAPALAHRLLSAIVPEEVSEVARVAIEWAPEPAQLYLNDRTAFDAFIEYRDTSGRLFALGIETKLTEPFSQKEYDGESYRRWMRTVNSPWLPASASLVHSIQHNQLWRDHLLAVALRHQPNSPYAGTRLMVVYHPEDHDCAVTIAAYMKLLNDGEGSVVGTALNDLVTSWNKVIGDGPEAMWLRDFSVRYLELQRSDPGAAVASR